MASVAHSSMTHAGIGRPHPPKRPFWSSDAKGYSGNNWHGFGGESTLLWALGMWPSKILSTQMEQPVFTTHAEDFGWNEPMLSHMLWLKRCQEAVLLLGIL